MILRTLNQNWHTPPPPIRIRTYGFQLKIGEWGFVLLCLLFDIWYIEYDEAADKACFKSSPYMKVKMNKLKCWNVKNFSRCYVPAAQYKLGLTVYATYRRQRVYRYCKTTRPKQPIRTSAISLPDLDLPLVKRRQVVYTRYRWIPLSTVIQLV